MSRKLKTSLVCENCKNEFQRSESELRKLSGRFCSRECWKIWTHSIMNPKNIQLICEQCGQDFLVSKKQVDSKKRVGRFCSWTCDKEYRRKNDCFFGNKDHSKRKEKHVNSAGYVLIYDPSRKRMIPEHRLVMEKMIGRTLEPWETVHHKDGSRDHNFPENLELFINRHVAGARVEDLYRHDIERLSLENNKLRAAFSQEC